MAEVSLRNAGCGAAPALVTTLDLLDGAGQSITALTYNLALTTGGFTARPLDAVLADLPQLAAQFASAII
jgi:hypothetical protein